MLADLADQFRHSIPISFAARAIKLLNIACGFWLDKQKKPSQPGVLFGRALQGLSILHSWCDQIRGFDRLELWKLRQHGERGHKHKKR